MKAGIILLLGAGAIVLYFLFYGGKPGGPLSSGLLGNYFPASGINPSPLTGRGLNPFNYTQGQTGLSSVGFGASIGASAATITTDLSKIFAGNPAATPTPAQMAGGAGVSNQTGTLSTFNGGLLQGPNPNGTPLSVSAGWQPTWSSLDALALTPPDTSVLTSPNIATPIDPLVGPLSTLSLPETGFAIDSFMPGYAPTVPTVSSIDLTGMSTDPSQPLV